MKNLKHRLQNPSPVFAYLIRELVPGFEFPRASSINGRFVPGKWANSERRMPRETAIKIFRRSTDMPENQVATQKKLKFRGLLVAVITATVGWGAAAPAQVVKGIGTAGTIPVWNGNSTIGNSIVSQSGSNVDVNGGVKASGPVSAPGFNGSFSGNGSGLSNVNASMLGGVGPSAFAQLGASNTFTADQTINSNLSLTGSINNTLTLQPNLSDSSGDQSSNVIGGFGGNGTFPGNSVASGVLGATIAGGGGGLLNFDYPNVVSGNWGTVGGGANNQAGGSSSTASTVAGGFQNIASGGLATVGGGNQNTASGGNATIGGGGINTASGDGATVSGGGDNTASGFNAAVSGGNDNKATLEGATVSGGEHNSANGKFATVPGGLNNTASGQGSFAAGTLASAANQGSFVWSDSSGIAFDTAPNQFIAKASGGFTFYTAPDATAGAMLASGSGSWASLSDRNVKANFMLVDGEAILKRLAALPISTWNYQTQSDSVRHMGPMAQDFREAFGLGEDERHISTVDSEGVALAAIQALYQEKQQEVQERQQEVSHLKDRLTMLENRLAALESSK
jgi:hypothetical protein